jgi:signal transduction histidine kinase
MKPSVIIRRTITFQVLALYCYWVNPWARRQAVVTKHATVLAEYAPVRHDIKLVRRCDEHLPEVLLDKHRVLQILINLIRNAKYACDESGKPDKQITVRATNGHARIKISVTDHGVGIPAENLTRIFNHGFTTRKDGHGFGLHSGALAAQQLGGALLVQSDGPGQGATFTLELPVQTNSAA